MQKIVKASLAENPGDNRKKPIAKTNSWERIECCGNIVLLWIGREYQPYKRYPLDIELHCLPETCAV